MTGDGDLITKAAGFFEGFDGDSSRARPFLSFWEDFRRGGLGGWGSFFFFFSLSASRTVELEDEDVSVSLTEASPWGSAPRLSSVDVLPVLRRVTGGRVLAGLTCLTLEPGLRSGATRLGDTDDMDVGVVSRLYGPGPGDSENLVEGLPLKALI